MGNKKISIIRDRLEHGIIYSYVNKKNGKRYIGRTIRGKRRKKDHLRESQRYKSLFDKILQKEGEENFEYEVLYEVDELRSKIFNILNEKERDYIKQYDCQVPNGYNISEGGGSVAWMIGYKPTEETLEKLRDSHKGKPSPMKGKHYPPKVREKIVKKWKETIKKKYEDGYVRVTRPISTYRIVADNDVEHIGVFPNAKEIERRLGVDYKRVHYVLGKRVPLDGTYIFIYENDDKRLIYNILKQKSAKKKEYKTVKQINQNDTIEAILPLTEATRKFGRHVSDCCNKKRKTCHGYKFEWVMI